MSVIEMLWILVYDRFPLASIQSLQSAKNAQKKRFKQFTMDADGAASTIINPWDYRHYRTVLGSVNGFLQEGVESIQGVLIHVLHLGCGSDLPT